MKAYDLQEETTAQSQKQIFRESLQNDNGCQFHFVCKNCGTSTVKQQIGLVGTFLLSTEQPSEGESKFCLPQKRSEQPLTSSWMPPLRFSQKQPILIWSHKNALMSRSDLHLSTGALVFYPLVFNEMRVSKVSAIGFRAQWAMNGGTDSRTSISVMRGTSGWFLASAVSKARSSSVISRE